MFPVSPANSHYLQLIRIAALCSTALPASHVLAQASEAEAARPVDTARGAAMEFLRLHQYDEAIGDAAEELVQQALTEAVLEAPEGASYLSPAYERQVRTIVGAQLETGRRAAAAAVSELWSDRDLVILNAFLRTPVGERYARSGPELIRVLTPRISAWARSTKARVRAWHDAAGKAATDRPKGTR